MNRRNALMLATAALATVPLLWAAVRSDAPPGPSSVVAADTPVYRAVPGMPPDVARLLQEGRAWRAARRLREVVRPDSPPELVLAAARAESAWGGWSRAATLLEGRPWLDRVGGGEGWLVLGRAREEAGRAPEAADAYARYLRGQPSAPGRAVAELRLGRLHLRAGRTAEGAAALARLRDVQPAASGWAAVLTAEALAARGDTGGVRRVLGGVTRMPAGRAAAAAAEAYRAARAPGAAGPLVLQLAAAASAPADRAAALAAAGGAAAAAGDDAAARRHYREAVAAEPGSRAAGDAAEALERLGALTADDRVLVGETFIRRGDLARGAAHLAAGLAGGGGEAARRDAVRLRAGRAFFVARRHADAVAVLAPLTGAAGPVGAEALYYTGRAQLRGAAGSARATFETLAARHPGSAWAGEGLFVLADLDDDAGRGAQAAAGYRRVVEQFPAGGSGGLAAARLGSAALRRGDAAGAARLWEQVRSRGGTAEARAQGAYWAGRAYAAAGDPARARERWREARRQAPLSYYAVLAAQRLGEPYWPPDLAAGPAADPAAAREALALLAAAELLRDAGYEADADAEVERLTATAQGRELRYALAEALSSRGWTVPAIRMARSLEAGGEEPNLRLLRILFPYPYRALLTAEARERGLDPYLVAALTRQESAFKARALSPAGARGLMQVMPGTGSGLAAGAGLDGFDAELLFDPGINVHLGTRYLATQMRTYGGNLPFVFSAYNAGPGRVARWRRFAEARDPEMFTERIPFEETREYVKILVRNIAVYRGLHGR